MFFVASSAATDIEVRVIRLGTEIPESNSGLVARTVALMQSCSVNSTSYAASQSAWRNALKAASLVHLRFRVPRDVTIDGQVHRIDEILVPLPQGLWPDHLFARSGEALISCAFYDPRTFRDLVWGAPFEFQNTPPYDALANLPNY